MPFSDRFTLRWTAVLDPAIRHADLDPHRVDLSKTSDSIPVKILEDIRTSRLILCDVTTENGVRNANVMYELGIAQAVRRPEEVLVVRSDNDSLPFDIAPILAESYHPDSGVDAPARAREQITESLRRALAQVDLTRHLAVQSIVDTIDVSSFEFLLMVGLSPITDLSAPTPLGHLAENPRVMDGFSRLLQQGVLQCSLPNTVGALETPGLTNIDLAGKISYKFTPLGRAVAKAFVERTFGDSSFEDILRVLHKGGHFYSVDNDPATRKLIDLVGQGRSLEDAQQMVISERERDVGGD